MTFRIVNKRHNFSTEGAIDFMDLSGEAWSAVLTLGIRNGILHVFAHMQLAF